MTHLMAKTFQQIQKQIEALTREAHNLRKKEIADVVARIKEAIAVYGLTAQDLGLAGTRGRPPKVKAAAAAPAPTATAKKTRKVKIKYRDNAGNTWTGRGSRPRWLRDAIDGGTSIESYLV